MDTRNNEALKEASIRFGETIAKYPIEEQIAIGLISANVINGCSWEFVRPDATVRNNLDKFKNSKVCSVQEVTYNHERKVYGYLVYMKMDHLCKLLSVANNGPLTDKDLQIASQHRKEATEALAKKIKSGYTGRIGIYCTNDSQTITVDGKVYPAYAVTLKELCILCEKLGYGIHIKGAVRKPADVLAREDAILKALTVAPSSNALFINIAPM